MLGTDSPKQSQSLDLSRTPSKTPTSKKRFSKWKSWFGNGNGKVVIGNGSDSGIGSGSEDGRTSMTIDDERNVVEQVEIAKDETRPSIEDVLKANKEWATKKVEEDPEFFERFEGGRKKPGFMVIGSSESPISPSELLGLNSTDVFTHTTLTPIFTPTDFTLLSSLTYGVKTLQIPHIIVCGDYNNSVISSLSSSSSSESESDILAAYLTPLTSLYTHHKSTLQSLPDEKKMELLSELTVLQTAYGIANTSIIRNAQQKQNVMVQAWCVGRDGIVVELARFGGDMEGVYEGAVRARIENAMPKKEEQEVTDQVDEMEMEKVEVDQA